MSQSLPFDAELIASKHKKFSDTIVFVHHYGGDTRSTLRHVRLVNELGFDAVRFNLISAKPKSTYGSLPISSDLKFGLRHIWADQIESVLNAIAGPKILYSFSMPSASAIEALARRRGQNVSGMICDGGPFLKLPQCVWNLYEHQYRISSRVFRALFTGLSVVLWGGLEYNREVVEQLQKIPKGFPLLSIRGWQDSLVAPAAIEEFFASQDHLDLEVLPLPEGKHLDGLKNFARDYVPRIEKFLTSVASPVSALEH